MSIDIEYDETKPIKSITLTGAAGWSVRFSRDGGAVHIGTMRDGEVSTSVTREHYTGPSVTAHDLEDAIELMQGEGWIV